MSELIEIPVKCKPTVVSDLNFDDRLHSTLRPASHTSHHHRLDPISWSSLDTFISCCCYPLEVHLHNSSGTRSASPTLHSKTRWPRNGSHSAPSRRRTRRAPPRSPTISSAKTFRRCSSIMLPTTTTTISIRRPKRSRWPAATSTDRRSPSSGETDRRPFKRSAEVWRKLESMGFIRRTSIGRIRFSVSYSYGMMRTTHQVGNAARRKIV